MKTHYLMFLLNIISILLSVAFYTLLERKLLGLSQNRLGPNKVIFYGLGQPFMDGLKLFKKTVNYNLKVYPIFFNFFCFFMLFMSLMMWVIIPFKSWVCMKSLLMFWVLSIISVSSFSLLMLGWSSLSKYSFLGGVRSVCQILSLEIILTLLLMIYFSLFKCLSMVMTNMKFCFLLTVYFFMVYIVMIIETHRAPFDLSEGESEIVSGYNTEFSSILFVFIFLAEYMSLLLMMLLLKFLMLYKTSMILMSTLIASCLFVRSCFPRVRYDVLMGYSWLKLLPASIILSLTFMSSKILS